jgi:hypothetical protein
VCFPTRSSYQGLYCVMEYVGRNKTKIVVKKYDKYFFIPRSMKVFKHLNPELKANPTLSTFGIHWTNQCLFGENRIIIVSTYCYEWIWSKITFAVVERSQITIP